MLEQYAFLLNGTRKGLDNKERDREWGYGGREEEFIYMNLTFFWFI